MRKSNLSSHHTNEIYNNGGKAFLHNSVNKNLQLQHCKK